MLLLPGKNMFPSTDQQKTHLWQVGHGDSDLRRKEIEIWKRICVGSTVGVKDPFEGQKLRWSWGRKVRIWTVSPKPQGRELM